MDDSDEALMARVARGDEVAYRLLSRRHVPAMLGLARRILGNAADAEDVAQEAMLRVWTHAPRWQPLAAFRTWLTRIVSISVSTANGARPGSSWTRPATSSTRRRTPANRPNRANATVWSPKRRRNFRPGSVLRSCLLMVTA